MASAARGLEAVDRGHGVGAKVWLRVGRMADALVSSRGRYGRAGLCLLRLGGGGLVAFGLAGLAGAGLDPFPLGGRCGRRRRRWACRQGRC